MSFKSIMTGNCEMTLIRILLCAAAIGAVMHVEAVAEQPDSVFYSDIKLVNRSCSGTDLELVLTTYVSYLAWGGSTHARFEWIGETAIDTIVFYGEPGYPVVSATQHRDLANESYSLRIWDTDAFGYGITHSYQGDLFEIKFRVDDGDTVAISETYPFTSCSPFWCFPVSYVNLDTTIVVDAQDAVKMPYPGDVDCSGLVNISDVVTIINYVFSGGSILYKQAGDVDRTCTITVSDAVRLISYIFAGGEAPLPGCLPE